jgi:hypothetical protein
VGVDAVTQHMFGFAQRYPGLTPAPASGLDAHHLVGRFGWVMSSPTPISDKGVEHGNMLPGLDFVEVTDEGRIQRIVGLFN